MKNLILASSLFFCLGLNAQYGYGNRDRTNNSYNPDRNPSARYHPNDDSPNYVVKSSSIHIEKDAKFRFNEVIQIRLRNQRGNYYELVGNSLFITNLIPGNYEILINRSGRITRLAYRLNPSELLKINIDAGLRLRDRRSFDENSEELYLVSNHGTFGTNDPNGYNLNYMNDQDFEIWFNNYSQNHFDDDLYEYLNTYYPPQAFHPKQINRVLGKMNFSEGKLKAAEKIVQLQPQTDFSEIEKNFNFNSDKQKFRTIVRENKAIGKP